MFGHLAKPVSGPKRKARVVNPSRRCRNGQVASTSFSCAEGGGWMLLLISSLRSFKLCTNVGRRVFICSSLEEIGRENINKSSSRLARRNASDWVIIMMAWNRLRDNLERSDTVVVFQVFIFYFIRNEQSIISVLKTHVNYIKIRRSRNVRFCIETHSSRRNQKRVVKPMFNKSSIYGRANKKWLNISPYKVDTLGYYAV